MLPEMEVFRQQPNRTDSADLVIRHLFAPPQHLTQNHRSEELAVHNGVMSRATAAASSVVFTHDDTGRKTLNTHYLLGVLASAAADSGRTPYWRRSLSQPASDFGSTIGNDAGMKVFDQLKPGIMQLVKTHQPRFITTIAQHIGK